MAPDELKDALHHLVNAVFPYATLPGACGGLVTFLAAVQKGRIYNNKYVRKALIEIAGGAAIASFCFTMISPRMCLMLTAFGVGVAWSAMLQGLRKRITKIVKAGLGED